MEYLTDFGSGDLQDSETYGTVRVRYRPPEQIVKIPYRFTQGTYGLNKNGRGWHFFTVLEEYH